LSYLPVAVDEFGGLNVIDDPQEIGLSQATALLNIDFSQPGRVRTRDGWALLSTSAAANAIQGLAYYKTSGTEYIVVADGATIYPFDLSTGAVGTTEIAASFAGGNNGFARFGTPASSRLYAASGGLHRFEISSWTTVASPTPFTTYVAVTANDNRLAIAANTVVASGVDGERVWFSDVGDPETFGANNYVRLWPGDGEPITALARWRDKLFAFKQSKFAVFTGTSTLSDGTPVFNYYAVDAGQGANPGAVVAGDDGLYFANNSGVYVTAGGPPTYISRPLEPWIRAGSFTGLPSLSMANLTLAYYARQLFVTDRTNQTTLVFDTVRKTWSVWQLSATAAFAVPASSSSGGLYFGASSSKKVARFSSASTADNGSAISWSYTTGYSDIGGYFRGAQVKAAERKTLRMTDIYGSGTLTHQVLALNGRPNDVADAGGSVTLGTAPAVARGRRRRATRGTYFAHKLSGSGVASVSKLTHWVTSPGSDA
jgi:hypothetical protein